VLLEHVHLTSKFARQRQEEANMLRLSSGMMLLEYGGNQSIYDSSERRFGFANKQDRLYVAAGKRVDLISTDIASCHIEIERGKKNIWIQCGTGQTCLQKTARQVDVSFPLTFYHIMFSPVCTKSTITGS